MILYLFLNLFLYENFSVSMPCSLITEFKTISYKSYCVFHSQAATASMKRSDRVKSEKSDTDFQYCW